jgi:glyoxylase I family protein
VQPSWLRFGFHHFYSRIFKEPITMSTPISTGAVHHLALTVSDVGRSLQFYTEVLGFQKIMDFGPRALLANGTFVLALTPPADPAQAIANDRFNENRVGLDHLSFGVNSRADLEAAVRLFEERGVDHGEIKDLGPHLPFYILAFRDPDNIQLELTAPYSA